MMLTLDDVVANNLNVPRGLTSALTSQSFEDVLYSFFRLENLTPFENAKEDYQNYVTVRLVTIIEQFCRKIMQVQIDNEKIEIPKNKKEITFSSSSSNSKETKSYGGTLINTLK